MLDTTNIEIIGDKGIYYNPASNKVESLILEGIEEIIKNYDVNGIHFDDYFYPASLTIDEKEYNKALEADRGLTLQEFRLNTITSLIKKTYDLSNEKDFWNGEENIETEHEKMFKEEGIKIKALIAFI